MPQVTVHIGGRNYRMGCGAGEEAHVEGLAKQVDAKIVDMRAAFKDLDDQRIVVMAAVALADDLAEAKRQAERREAAAADELARETAAREAVEAHVAELQAAIEETATRVEALTESLNAPAED
jgi:cell division protein ZapA